MSVQVSELLLRGVRIVEGAGARQGSEGFGFGHSVRGVLYVIGCGRSCGTQSSHTLKLSGFG